MRGTNLVRRASHLACSHVQPLGESLVVSDAAENKIIDPQPPEGALPESKPADASAESKPADTSTPSDAKPAGKITARPMRRPGSNARFGKASGAAGDAVKPPAPPPSHLKMGLIVATAVVALACVGLGAYIYMHPRNTPASKLDERAAALKKKAERAAAMYAEGKTLSASDKYEDMTDAQEKLTEASGLFYEISESYQTIDIPGVKENIQLANEKKLSIDTDLHALRERIRKIDDDARREKSKAAQANKPPETNTPTTPPPTINKEPKPEELTDENLNKLFDNDPSEYDRLAKIRKEKDPTYVIRKP
jgi:hypothetical protein